MYGENQKMRRNENDGAVTDGKSSAMLIDTTVDDVYNLVVGRPATIRTDSVLKDAVDAMIGNPESQKVYVVDEKGIMLGMITMQSLLEQVGYRIGARKSGVVSFLHLMKDILHEDVGHFMVEKPKYVRKDTKLTEALKLMVELKINDLPVTDENNVLIGELNGLEILVAARKLFKEKEIPAPIK